MVRRRKRKIRKVCRRSSHSFLGRRRKFRIDEVRFGSGYADHLTYEILGAPSKQSAVKFAKRMCDLKIGGGRKHYPRRW